MQNTTWQNLIPEGQAQEDFGFCGFYVRNFKDTSLQLIALNTNLYYRTNITTADPCSQLVWLERYHPYYGNTGCGVFKGGVQN